MSIRTIIATAFILLTAGAAIWLYQWWPGPHTCSGPPVPSPEVKKIHSISFPGIIEAGKLPNDFIPAEWHLRDLVTTDLNGDKLSDYALVIESTKEFVSDSNGKFNGPPFYPKMLLILFKQKSGTYSLSTVATKLFSDYNWGVQGMDPLDTLVLRNGSLCISFLTGGYTRDHLTYILSYHDEDWFLSGVDRYQYYLSNRGKTRMYANYNFETGIKESYYYANKKRSDFSRENIALSKIKLADIAEHYELPIAMDE